MSEKPTATFYRARCVGCDGNLPVTGVKAARGINGNSRVLVFQIEAHQCPSLKEKKP